jgi:hypothetical protein
VRKSTASSMTTFADPYPARKHLMNYTIAGSRRSVKGQLAKVFAATPSSVEPRRDVGDGQGRRRRVAWLSE